MNNYNRSSSKYLVWLIFSVVFLACGGTALVPTPTAVPPSPTPNPAATVASNATPAVSLTTAPVSELSPPPYKIEVFARGVILATALEFAPDGRLFAAEKNGTVRTVSPDGVVSDPVLTLTNIDVSGERGLLGMTLDPSFAETGYLWVFYTRGDALIDRISRFTLQGDTASDEQVSFEFRIAFETSTILNGGGIRFGPDGMLYIAAGSTNNVNVSNEPGAPQAKIHRVDPTTFPAQPAPGNPDPASTIYASGLRNVFDFTFHPVNGLLYATENGGDCDDEINIVEAGGDYGWHTDGLCEDYALPLDYPYKKPLLYFTPTIGPTGITPYTGTAFPDWYGSIFFCSWHGTRLVRLEIKEDGYHLKKSERIETGADKPCLVDVMQGPDGNVYYNDLTNIYRVVPAK